MSTTAASSAAARGPVRIADRRAQGRVRGVAREDLQEHVAARRRDAARRPRGERPGAPVRGRGRAEGNPQDRPPPGRRRPDRRSAARARSSSSELLAPRRTSPPTSAGSSPRSPAAARRQRSRARRRATAELDARCAPQALAGGSRRRLRAPACAQAGAERARLAALAGHARHRRRRASSSGSLDELLDLALVIGRQLVRRGAGDPSRVRPADRLRGAAAAAAVDAARSSCCQSRRLDIVGRFLGGDAHARPAASFSPTRWWRRAAAASRPSMRDRRHAADALAPRARRHWDAADDWLEPE